MWQALQGGDDTAGGSHHQQSSHRATARYEGEECTHSGLGMSGFHDDFLVSPLNKKIFSSNAFLVGKSLFFERMFHTTTVLQRVSSRKHYFEMK